MSTPVSTATLTVAAILMDARERLCVSLPTAATRTKIPEKTLEIFESGNFVGMSDDVYTRIHLKAYCHYLQLDEVRVIALYRQERMRVLVEQRRAARRQGESEPSLFGVNSRRHPVVPIAKSSFIVMPQVMRQGLIVLAVMAVASYFWFSLQSIVTPPTITLVSPLDGFVATENGLVVEGQTEREVTLDINGKTITSDSSGRFRDQIDLQPGLNTITITGLKKHSNPTTITRRVVLEAVAKEPVAVYGPAVPAPAPKTTIVPAKRTIVVPAVATKPEPLTAAATGTEPTAIIPAPTVPPLPEYDGMPAP